MSATLLLLDGCGIKVAAVLRRAIAAADAWNEAHRVGTAVIGRPGLGYLQRVDHTATGAFVRARDRTAVVALAETIGLVPLADLVVVTADTVLPPPIHPITPEAIPDAAVALAVLP
jgi:hypothetical protein